MSDMWKIVIDGDSLSLEKLMRLADPRSKIAISETAIEAVGQSRRVVDQMLESRQVAYGINTGFGLFSNVIIDSDKLDKLQVNLIRSHSSGVGRPLTYGRTRMLLAVRINVLCRGNSGVSLKTLHQMVEAFNAGCISVVPCQGTVGASGDLAPLAHLALGLIGEGMMWSPPPEKLTLSDSTNQVNGRELYRFQSINKQLEMLPASQVLKEKGLKPISLGPKEGLALINGTQMITALGAEAAFRARNIACCADVISALTLEVLKGTVNAFHPRIHERRPHKGQSKVAARLRALLHPGQPSELFLSHKYHGRVQDPYSLRCIPQVHGITVDTIDFVQSILEVELNSSGDNPMVFAEPMDITEVVDGQVVHVWPPKRMVRNRSDSVDSSNNVQSEEPEDLESAKEEIRRLKACLAERNEGGNAAGFKRPSDTFYNNGAGSIISGGNFHAEYPAKALDYLTIGVAELASISERRLERLVNPSLSHLPAFLVEGGGLNSGFMIAHCCAAALVSENKVLCHPASVDSISTSGAKEDHVSMGGMSARKALQVVENVERVLAIELLAAAQALEFHRPLRTTEPLEAAVELVRTVAAKWDEDRIMNVDIDAVTEIITTGRLWATVRPFLVDFSGTQVDETSEDSFI